MPFLSYWFWPNPGGWHYTDSRVMTLMGVCVVLILLSFAIRLWRKRLTNSVTSKLSRSWSSAAFWFGLTGLFLAASRVETIQFLSMRSLWVLWLLCIVLYAFFQVIQFRRRHYTVLARTNVIDERDRYLPKRR